MAASFPGVSDVPADGPSAAHPLRRRRLAAVLLNLIVPGSGLIIARREWFGVLVALLFALCAHVAVAGALFAPAAVPAPIIWTAAGAAGLVWLVAQVVLVRRLRWLASDDARAQFALLLGDGQRAAAAGDIVAARLALRGALEINDEDPVAHLEYARVLVRTDPAAARRVWRRLAALDPRGRAGAEARARLADGRP